MRRLLPIAAFALAALAAWGAGVWLATAAERLTRSELARALDAAALPWVRFEVDGLTAHLTGQAPGEAARLAALRAAAEVVGPGRLTEAMILPRERGAVAPVFRIEVMRQGSDLSLVGLVPEAEGTAPLVARFAGLVPSAEVADMLQTAEYPAPPGWSAAIDFAAAALTRFEIGRISVSQGRIALHALVDGPETRRRIEADLRAIAPRSAVLTLDLVAPRPVLAPFLFRLARTPEGLRLEACAADTEAAAAAIERALRSAGYTGRSACPVGLGSPSPRWAQAVERGIAALLRLPEGTLTLSDQSVRLEAPHDADRAAFDAAAGRLEADLPEAFVLSAALLPPPPEAGPADSAPPEFRIVLDPEGHATISGRLPDARLRQVVGTYARSRFGSAAVTLETRLDPDLPPGWTRRVLAGLEALAELQHGRLTLGPDRLVLEGVSGQADAAARIGQLLAARLGSADGLALRITYDERFDPVAQEPTPDRCEGWVRAAQAERKITFAPGSARLDEDSAAVLDAIAEVLRRCGELALEVSGHTDSQGRAETNQTLSQARAEAVIAALGARAVLTASMVARGYGADRPVGDNATDEGREANRRIEFALIRPAPDPDELDEAGRADLESRLVFAPRPVAQGQTRPQPRPEALAGSGIEPRPEPRPDPPTD